MSVNSPLLYTSQGWTWREGFVVIWCIRDDLREHILHFSHFFQVTHQHFPLKKHVRLIKGPFVDLKAAAHKLLQASLSHMVILFYERCLGTIMLVNVCVHVWRPLRNVRSLESTVHVALMVHGEGTCLGRRLSNHHWPWLAKCFSSCGSADLFYLYRNKSQGLIRLHAFVSVRLRNCGWLARAVSHLCT